MSLKKTHLILIILSSLFFFQNAYAQNMGRQMKRNVATVFFSTLGGAVLGLSTLSFYGEPQEHTDNITLGAALGMVAGVGYLSYQSQKPLSQSYEYSDFNEWDQKNKRASLYKNKALPLVQVQFDF